jgi:hypothetical protein
VSVVVFIKALDANELYKEHMFVVEMNVAMLQFEFAEHDVMQFIKLEFGVTLSCDELVLLTVIPFFSLYIVGLDRRWLVLIKPFFYNNILGVCYFIYRENGEDLPWKEKRTVRQRSHFNFMMNIFY